MAPSKKAIKFETTKRCRMMLLKKAMPETTTNNNRKVWSVPATTNKRKKRTAKTLKDVLSKLFVSLIIVRMIN